MTLLYFHRDFQGKALSESLLSCPFLSLLESKTVFHVNCQTFTVKYIHPLLPIFFLPVLVRLLVFFSLREGKYLVDKKLSGNIHQVLFTPALQFDSLNRDQEKTVNMKSHGLTGNSFIGQF